jgi:hypothetical protein
MSNSNPSFTKDKRGYWVVVPPDIKQKAKELYFANASHTAIAKECDVARSTVTTWVNKGWREEREIKRLEDLNDFFLSKKHEYVDISAKIVNSLKGYAEYLVTKPSPLTEKEAKTAVEILDKLDKQTRLDENRPTEITNAEKPVTIIELKEKLKVDPFAQIEDVEHEEKND